MQATNYTLSRLAKKAVKFVGKKTLEDFII